MKKTHILFLLMLNMQSMSMYAAQESKQNIELGRQTMIDNTVKNLTYLTDGFDFLRTQNLVDTSFHDFLEQNISHDEDGNEDMNFDQVIVDAEDVLTKNMKDTFLTTLETALQERKDLSQFNDPLFLYVMKHKDTTMQNMIHLWVYEWNKDKNKYCNTALHEAVEKKNKEIVQMLVDKGADLNLQDYIGCTPLHRASWGNNQDITQMLIAVGANLNLQDKFGDTALHQAVENNSVEIVQMLIDKAADLNLQDKNGDTALHQAVLKNNKDIVQMLIDARVNLNIQNQCGDTALHIAISLDRAQFVQVLIDKGAHLNIKDSLCRTPLALAISQENTKIIASLLVARADVNIKDYFGRSLLHAAVLKNNIKIIKMMINAGACINHQDENGQTPLHVASSWQGRFDTVRILIDKGANINIQDDDGRTPLHVACIDNSLEIARMLIKEKIAEEAKSIKMRIIFARTQYARSSSCTIS